MRRWHHGHSMGTGVLGGLLLSRRPEVVFAAGFAAGIGLMYARGIAHWLALALEDSRRRFARRVARATMRPTAAQEAADDGIPF